MKVALTAALMMMASVGAFGATTIDSDLQSEKAGASSIRALDSMNFETHFGANHGENTEPVMEGDVAIFQGHDLDTAAPKSGDLDTIPKLSESGLRGGRNLGTCTIPITTIGQGIAYIKIKSPWAYKNWAKTNTQRWKMYNQAGELIKDWSNYEYQDWVTFDPRWQDINFGEYFYVTSTYESTWSGTGCAAGYKMLYEKSGKWIYITCTKDSCSYTIGDPEYKLTY